MTNCAFQHGDRVKLLVSFYARPAFQQVKHKFVRKRPASRFLLSSERLRFVADRPELPGGCIVADEFGARWFCPRDYLTFPHLVVANVAEAA